MQSKKPILKMEIISRAFIFFSIPSAQYSAFSNDKSDKN
jgi:hypothetical protein